MTWCINYSSLNIQLKLTLSILSQDRLETGHPGSKEVRLTYATDIDIELDKRKAKMQLFAVSYFKSKQRIEAHVVADITPFLVLTHDAEKVVHQFPKLVPLRTEEEEGKFKAQFPNKIKVLIEPTRWLDRPGHSCPNLLQHWECLEPHPTRRRAAFPSAFRYAREAYLSSGGARMKRSKWGNDPPSRRCQPAGRSQPLGTLPERLAHLHTPVISDGMNLRIQGVVVNYLPRHFADRNLLPSLSIRGLGFSAAFKADMWINLSTPHSLAMRAIVLGAERTKDEDIMNQLFA